MRIGSEEVLPLRSGDGAGDGFACRNSHVVIPEGFSVKKFISRWMQGSTKGRRTEARMKARFKRKLFSLLSNSLKKR